MCRQIKSQSLISAWGSYTLILAKNLMTSFTYFEGLKPISLYNYSNRWIFNHYHIYFSLNVKRNSSTPNKHKTNNNSSIEFNQEHLTKNEKKKKKPRTSTLTNFVIKFSCINTPNSDISIRTVPYYTITKNYTYICVYLFYPHSIIIIRNLNQPQHFRNNLVQ